MAPKAPFVKRLLAGAGVTREDSDDELGVDDLSWEWLVEEDRDKIPRISGAKFGNFSCAVGDCVLLKAGGYKEAWVAIICEFLDNLPGNGEKGANFMWFSSVAEIRNRERKRTDALRNELYITPAFDVNPLTSINGSAKVMSLSRFRSLYPSGLVPRNSKDFGKMFVCRRGCNVRTAIYTDEFDWEEIYAGARDIDGLIAMVKTDTKRTKRQNKRKASNAAVIEELDRDSEPYDRGTPFETPRKKHRTQPSSTDTTPRKNLTPTRQRASIKKPLEYTPLGKRLISPKSVSSPFQIARMRLHVSSVPLSLPCREEAFSQVYLHLEAAISDGLGSCIYISGTPGTGKTATVKEAVSQLHEAVRQDELDDFVFVEINGMKVTDPHQAYTMLWEALKGDRVSPSHALDLLEQEFSNASPRRIPCVVLMDELDQLVTRNQSVMYNFFNWPNLQHSRLIVLAVANTMDLPERTLSLTRITFPGYTHDQLIKIIQSRLEGVPGSIVDPDAVQFASRKIAAVSGDARRALDICRRAVEIVEAENTGDSQDWPLTPSKPTREAREKGKSIYGAHGRVTISTIKQAISEATSSPLQQCLRMLPLATKVFLAALVSRMSRTGILESSLHPIFDEVQKLAIASQDSSIGGGSWNENGAMTMVASDRLWNTVSGASRLEALGTSMTELAEAGIISFEARRGERIGKVRLNVGEDEVQLALGEDPDLDGLGFTRLGS